MICLIAGNKTEAETWASAQNLEREEWFFPDTIFDIRSRSNFHTLVIGTAGWNVHPKFFEQIYALAQERGKIGRM